MRLFLLSAVFASSALAQSASLMESPHGRGLVLPPTSAAMVEDATALRLNPAALTQLGALELFYAHEFRRSPLPGRWGGADALYLASKLPGLGYGASVEWVSGPGLLDARRVTYGLGFGSEGLSLGASVGSLHSTEQPGLSDDWLVDVGLLSRPHRSFSVGLVGRNLNGQEGTAFRRSFEVAIAARPLDERLTLGVDYRFNDDAGLLAGTLGYTVDATLWKGVGLSAGVAHGLTSLDPVAFQLGLRLDLERLGLWMGGGSGPHGNSLATAVRLSLQRYPSIPSLGGQVVLIDLADQLRGGGGTLGALLGFGEDDAFTRTVQLLDLAARDPELTGVVLKLDSLPNVGLAKVEELRAGLLRLRAAGKHVSAVLMTVQDSEYLLATAADRIYALPQSYLAVNGLVSRSRFLGGTLEKVGVTVDVARVGAYKNAPDAFTRKDMSPEQREAATALLDNATRVLEQGIAESRKLDPAALQRALSRGLLSPQEAKALGLVDEVLSTQQLEKLLEKQFPTARYQARYQPDGIRDPAWGTRRKIAVIPILGNIDGGKSRRAPFGGELVAGAETVVRAIQQAADDPRVVAIILRVDSPGGGVLASDLMYRAAKAAREEKKKVVVASMGDVAASGGYYVAAAAEEIFASPSTITGSIGVFMVKPALQGLYEKLGITQEALVRGENADILGDYRPWTESERADAQHWVDSTYDQFITLVADSRQLQKPRVDELARGRVWSGTDAKERGLVDTFGGLWEAIASARARAQVPESEPLELRVYGEPRGLLSAPGGEPGVLAPLMELPVQLPGSGMPPTMVKVLEALGPDAAWLSTGVQARMEFDLSIE